MIINKQDTDGVKSLLEVGELGYDNYADGGDVGRVSVGTGVDNKALAFKDEVKDGLNVAAFITHSFTANEELEIPLNKDIDGAIIGIQKELPQTEFVNEDWFVSVGEFEGENGITISNTITTTVTNQYKTATSKTPINTSLWAEINSFIPTQTLNNGEINYSFSKDNKESFIISNGTNERTIAKNDGGVWKYNSNVVFEAETFLNASVNDMNVALDEAMGSALVQSTYNIKNAKYLNKSFSIAPQSTNPNKITFSSNGLKAFILDANAGVFEYSLGVPFDITTATYSNKNFVPTVSNNFGGVFNKEGTRYYITNGTQKQIYQYSLSTAYDISTMELINSVAPFAEGESLYILAFNEDGTTVIIGEGQQKKLVEFTLSVPYDITTIQRTEKEFLFSTLSSSGYFTGFGFGNNGKSLIISAGVASDTLYQLSLEIPYDISTASLLFSFSPAEETSIRGFTFNGDGSGFFIVGYSQDTIFQYDTISTSSQNSSIVNGMPLLELSDNLNLAITMKSTGTSPTFTNMDINYDGLSKWQKATPNTDYQVWQQGDNNKVTIKALSANNLKARIL